MEYPVGWGIKETNVSVSQNANLKLHLDFYKKPYKKYSGIFIFNVNNGNLHDNFSHRGNYWTERINKGLVPDARINGVDVYINIPDIYDTQNDLDLYFEKNNFVYSFGEVMGAKSYENDEIIEHMIKSLHFLK